VWSDVHLTANHALANAPKDGDAERAGAAGVPDRVRSRNVWRGLLAIVEVQRADAIAPRHGEDVHGHVTVIGGRGTLGVVTVIGGRVDGGVGGLDILILILI